MNAWTLLAGAALATEPAGPDVPEDEVPDAEDLPRFGERRVERPRGAGFGITLLGENGLRFNLGLENGADFGVQATIGPSPWGGIVGVGLLYDFPSPSRWQFQLRGGPAVLPGAVSVFAGVAAEYDPPSSFFLTIPAQVYVSRAGAAVWIAPSLGWVVDWG